MSKSISEILNEEEVNIHARKIKYLNLMKSLNADINKETRTLRKEVLMQYMQETKNRINTCEEMSDMLTRLSEAFSKQQKEKVNEYTKRIPSRT